MTDWMKHSDRMQDIFEVIIGESERGAVLLACHIIDDFLMIQLRQYKNSKVSNKTFQDTTSYGGAFGSLSMKSKALFVMGVLTEQTFQAIENLRKIRNKAAHSEREFHISEHQANFDSALAAFGNNHSVKNLALEIAMASFIDRMKLAGIELVEQVRENPWPNEAACVEYLSGNKKLQDQLKSHLPKWQVAALTYLIVETIGMNFEQNFPKR